MPLCSNRNNTNNHSSSINSSSPINMNSRIRKEIEERKTETVPLRTTTQQQQALSADANGIRKTYSKFEVKQVQTMQHLQTRKLPWHRVSRVLSQKSNCRNKMFNLVCHWMVGIAA